MNATETTRETVPSVELESDIPIGVIVASHQQDDNIPRASNVQRIFPVTFLYHGQTYQISITPKAHVTGLIMVLKRAFSLHIESDSVVAIHDTFSPIIPIEWAAIAPNALQSDVYHLRVYNGLKQGCCGWKRLSAEPRYGLLTPTFAANVSMFT